MASKEELSIIHNEKGQPVEIRINHPQRLHPETWREILECQVALPQGAREVEIWKADKSVVPLTNDLNCLRKQVGLNRNLHLDLLASYLNTGQTVVIRDTTQGETNSRPRVRSAKVEKPDLRKATVILRNAARDPNIRILLARPGKKGKVSCEVINPHQEFGSSVDQRKMTALLKKMGKSVITVNKIPDDLRPMQIALLGDRIRKDLDRVFQSVINNPNIIVECYQFERDINAGEKTKTEYPYFLKLTRNQEALEGFRAALQEADVIILRENSEPDE